MSYDPDQIQTYFDSYGREEWERLVSSPKNLMSLQIHQHYLSKYIKSGDQVLELGAGAGRFSIFMAQLGVSLVTSDLSPVQLDLTRQNIRKAGHEAKDYLLLDITDLSSLKPNSFDTVVVIGGPLSYVLDKRKQAMQQILGVTRPGGIIIIGVMSRYGAMQRLVSNYIPDLLEGKTTIRDILENGDDMGYLAFEGHHHHLFTSQELRDFLLEFPVEIVELTSTAYLTMQKSDQLKTIVKDTTAWKHLLEMELAICREMIDGGSHMLAIIRRK